MAICSLFYSPGFNEQNSGTFQSILHWVIQTTLKGGYTFEKYTYSVILPYKEGNILSKAKRV